MSWRRRRGLFLILLAAAPVLVRFFTPYPDTWDAAEYSWCLRQSYLPHSPYLLFFLLGRCFHLVLPAPVALTALSALSGIASLALFYEILARTLGRQGPAAIATLLLAASGVFVREATHQEVYALETFWILLSLVLVSGELRRPIWSGIAFGAAVATHSSSLFVAPAILLFVGQAPPADRPGPGRATSRALPIAARPMGVWLLSAVTTAAVAAALVVAILPVEPGQSRVVEGLRYLEGIGPQLDAGRWDADFLARSLWGQLDRLFAIAGGQVSAPRYAVGFSAVHLVAAGIGAVLVLRRRRSALVWCLYPVPYLLWELLLGASPDVGAYLPLAAPAVCALAAVAVDGLARRRRLLAAIAVLALVAPSAVRTAGEWNRVRDEAVDHFSPQVLAAQWLDVHLPPDAVVVNTVPATLNSFAYYSGRRPILVDGRRATIFHDRGRFTPVNARSFEPLSTEHLAELVRGGRPVVAIESAPFRGVPRLDRSRFVWREVDELDLADAAALAASSRAVSGRLVKGRRTVYRLFSFGADITQ